MLDVFQTFPAQSPQKVVLKISCREDMCVSRREGVVGVSSVVETVLELETGVIVMVVAAGVVD